MRVGESLTALACNIPFVESSLISSDIDCFLLARTDPSSGFTDNFSNAKI